MNEKQLPKCLFLKGKFLIFSREILGGKNRNMSTEINRSKLWCFEQTQNKWLLCIIYFEFFFKLPCKGLYGTS